ncbi:hypothetical protein [Streptomyces laurentii]|uniref:hypothetical protein n=1 Tax=Streptomyces laurentii TaxID=39478 RepID=UPI0036BCC42D
MVDPDVLPGTYRDAETGGEVVLGSDGTFSATAVSTDGSSDPDDFSGRWEFVDSKASDEDVPGYRPPLFRGLAGKSAHARRKGISPLTFPIYDVMESDAPDHAGPARQ